MSIIYDALKKVAVSTNDNINSKGKPDKKERKPKSRLLYILTICFGLFVVSVFLIFSTKEQNPPRSNITKSQDTNLSSAISKPADIQKQSKISFSLNGVFFSENEGYALINNQIVKEGDKIDGATVMRIGLDEVELEFEGSTIKLSNTR